MLLLNCLVSLKGCKEVFPWGCFPAWFSCFLCFKMRPVFFCVSRNILLVLSVQYTATLEFFCIRMVIGGRLFMTHMVLLYCCCPSLCPCLPSDWGKKGSITCTFCLSLKIPHIWFHLVWTDQQKEEGVEQDATETRAAPPSFVWWRRRNVQRKCWGKFVYMWSRTFLEGMRRKAGSK